MELTKQGFEYRDTDHAYFYDGKKMTGCTTILGVLNKPALIGWASRMAVDYVKEHAEYTPETPDGEVLYYHATPELLDLAQKAWSQKRDDRAGEGKGLHALIEEYIGLMIKDQGGKPMEMNDDPTHKWASINKFIEWAQSGSITFLSSEEKFYSKSLFVAGTADFTFTKDGKRFIGDVKNKKKIWSREPMAQCAGYAIMSEEMGSEPYEGYCVVRVWEDEIEPLWSYDVVGDKKAFINCVEIYRWLANWNK